ncbi:DUF4435 domain-containing protein [candidate division KSB1 bacterium]|nr:DUF4435 domain-containing protein [candidate division KSB1 bacterium]
MSDLSYSDKALDVLSLFHRRKYVVYVEGPDDRPFWTMILQLFGMRDFIIKIAGGRLNLEKYVSAVINEGVNIVVARDSDYLDLFDINVEHPRIINTYGYSIENTLYCPKNIATAITIYSRSEENYEEEVIEWMNLFVNSFIDLLVMDIASEKFNKSVEVLGNRCNRFLKSKNSPFACEKKINEKIVQLQEQFTVEQINEVKNILDQSEKSPYFIIRGHFLTNAVINFIKEKVKQLGKNKFSMSIDMLYGQMVAQFNDQCLEQDDTQYLKAQVHQLIGEPLYNANQADI